MKFPEVDHSGTRGPAHRFRSDPGAHMVLYHQQWLTVMIQTHRQLPRIPVRRVTEGGFAGMLTRPGGRARAERWWRAACEAIPLQAT